MIINALNTNTFEIKTIQLDVNFQDVKNPLLVPTPLTLCINGLDNQQFNVFDLFELNLNSFNSQLESFKKNGKINIMYLNTAIGYADYYDDLIVPFCRKNKIKLVVRAGDDLSDMGLCDYMYKTTPIGFLEEYGILDLQPIILSAARLEKEDLEKLSYYNATVCLDLSTDLIQGNGIPQIPTMQKYNLNIMLNVRNDVFEELRLVYMLSNGIFNHEQNYANVLKMALVNGYKAFGIKHKDHVLLQEIYNPEFEHMVLNCNKSNIVTKVEKKELLDIDNWILFWYN